MFHRALAFALGLTLLCAGSASAELSQKGNLFVSFGGGISPKALPRHALAPIGVRIEGGVNTPAGQVPPSLRKIEIALNKAGHLDTQGLPTCRAAQLRAAAPSEALRACGPSLLGSGGIVAQTALVGQTRSLVRAEVLLFNGRKGGRSVIYGHIYQANPTPIARLVTFEVKRKTGTFGTVVSGEFPPSLNRNGYLTSIFLTLERRYSFHGKERSYLSAACSAPRGFTKAVFPFARASMSFDDGRTLSATLTRSCAVRR